MLIIQKLETTQTESNTQIKDISELLKETSRRTCKRLLELIKKNNDENSLLSLDIEDDVPDRNATLPGFCDAMGTLIDKYDEDTKDGQIGNTKQGETGDCWLLSGVNALSYTEAGREIIKDALEYTDDGVIVHLKGLKDYTVTNLEIAQTKASYQYSDGDDDMIAFELAIEKALDSMAKTDFMVNDEFNRTGLAFCGNSRTTLGRSSTNGGVPLGALYLITGKTGFEVYHKDDLKHFLDIFQYNKGKDLVITASISLMDTIIPKNVDISREIEPKNVVDINGNTIKLPRAHSYAIKNVDDNNVTFVNPWDSSVEYTISREIFLDTFDKMDFCNLLDDSSIEDIIIHPILTTDNGDKIFLRETKAHSTGERGMELSAYSKNGWYLDGTFISMEDIGDDTERFDAFIKDAIENYSANRRFWNN